MKGLEEFRLAAEVPVRFRDTDAMGHVNNAVYLSYLEQARLEYVRSVLGRDRLEDIGLVVARVEIDYRSPSFFHEVLMVGVRVTRLGGASFDAAYRIVEKKTGRLVAEAKSVQVAYDYKAGRVAKLGEEAVRRMKEHDGIA